MGFVLTPIKFHIQLYVSVYWEENLNNIVFGMLLKLFAQNCQRYITAKSVLCNCFYGVY
jgi:hypothetical protein